MSRLQSWLMHICCRVFSCFYCASFAFKSFYKKIIADPNQRWKTGSQKCFFAKRTIIYAYSQWTEADLHVRLTGMRMCKSCIIKIRINYCNYAARHQFLVNYKNRYRISRSFIFFLISLCYFDLPIT